MLSDDEVRKLPAFHRLVWWVQEREAIRLKKEAGESKPWTSSKILRDYRFCNVRRMDDRVSKWLLDTWYEPYKDHPNIVAACVLARFVNLPDTLRNIGADIFHGPPGQRVGTKFSTSKPVDLARMEKTLRNIKGDGYAIFNGAYIIPPGKGKDKIDSVVNHVLRSVVENPPAVDTASMENTHREFMKVDGCGSFLAGQITSDLRWAVSGEWKDKHSWAAYGPGSVRGMERLLTENYRNPLPRYDFLDELRGLRDRLQYSLPEAITDRLEMCDYQSVLCETDKMNRVLEGTGKPKQLYNGRG